MNLSNILLILLLFAGHLFAQNPPATFQFDVTDGTITHTVDFSLHSARGANFEVQVQQADGSFVVHTPAASRTYIGTIASLPGAMVAGLRRADGSIYYHVLFEDGSEWINNGSGTALRTGEWTARWPSYVVNSGGSGSDIWAAEVGIDLPNSQYSIAGSSDAALEMIDHSVNITNLLYLRDAGIIHKIGRVVLRADASQDPYAGMTSVGAMYPEHQNEWRVILPAILPPSNHDITMVTSSAAGSGGGVAGGGVGGTAGLSANGSSVEGDFSIIWRHEAGHNWSLGHQDGNTPEGPTINSGNALSRMSGPEQARVLGHRASRSNYLDNLGPYAVAIPPKASLDRVSYELASTQVVIDVLDNDSDANGDAFSITSFQTTSPKGGSVTLSSGTGPNGRDQLVYSPPSQFLIEPDHFTYRITDATGRTSTGNVIIRTVIQSDLLVHYTLDDAAGSVAVDSSSYAQNGSVKGGGTWTAGAIGGAIRLDGIDDRVEGAELSDSTNTITLTAWVKRDGDQGRFDGIAFNRGVSSAMGLNMGTNNQLGYHWNNQFWGWNSGLVIPDNTWTFVALVVRPSGATLYMNDGTGMQTANNNATHAVEDLSGRLDIGLDPLANRKFKGSIDDVRLYSRNFSTAEISDLASNHGTASTPSPQHLAQFYASRVGLSWTPMPTSTSHRVYFSANYTDVRDGTVVADLGTTTSNNFTSPILSQDQYFWRVDSFNGTSWVSGSVWMFTIVPDEKIAHWKFDEGSGATASDSSGNNYSATFAGDAGWASGVSGGGIVLDGDGDYLVGPNLNESKRNLSITGWVKRNGNQAIYTGIVFARGSKGTGLHFGNNNDLRYHWNSNNWGTSSGLIVPDGVWTFVGLTVEGGTATFYMDAGSGMQTFSMNTFNLAANFDSEFYIGKDPDAVQFGIREFRGSMDDVRIYDRVLSGAEMLILRGVPSASNSSSSIAENVVTGTSVGSVVVSDANNDPLSYEITSGNTGGAFAIDANTGEITTSAVLDYETLTSYALTVTATDPSGLFGTATVSIAVTNVASGDDSDGDGLDDDWEVIHFGNTSTQIGSGDADNDGLTNAGEFAANTNPNSLDSDGDGFSDKFEVDQSSDPNSSTSIPDTLLAAFWDFNNSAVSSESKDRVGAIQGSIVSGAAYTSDAGGRSSQSGDLGMDFGTTTGGQRVDVASAAFLNAASGDDRLTISYWQKLASTGSQSSSFWAVSPSSPSAQRGIQAHSPWSNNRIYFDMGGAGGGSRIDVAASSVTWTSWNHIALVKNGSTAEIWVNGVRLRTLSGMSPLKTDISRLVIGASGTGGNSLQGVIDDFAVFKTALDSGQIGNLASGVSPVDIVEVANQAPVANDTSLTVSENSSAGTTVGTVTASDSGDTLSYAITAGNSGGEFAIDSNSGIITTATALDFEASASYALTVTVTDSGSLTDTAVVTVNVTNVNESPTANNSSGTIAEDASIGAAVATVTSTDPDAGDSVTYAITAGNAAGAFTINSASGEITTATALDFETTPSYVLTVSASDSGGLSATASVNITVEDVVEVTSPSVSTGIARNVTQTSADIDFSVTDDGGEAPVLTLYYGLTNGGVTAGNWSNSTSLGAQSVGSYSSPLSGLAPGTTYYYTTYASNSAGEAWGSSSSFTTEADTSPKLVRTTVNGVSSENWTTVNLGQNYNSAVIIATPIYPDSTGIPVVTRIRNVTSNSFEVKIDTVASTANVETVDVSIIAVEEGVYTQANDGVTMEAVKYTSSVTSYKNGWTAEARSYQNSYTTPVVVGQVMSANDTEWSTFWCQGSSRTSPPSATSLNVGKHVGEDGLTTRADETIGYIVIESGNGTINGIAYSAGLGGDTIRGVGNTSTGYTYSLSGLSSASAAAVSIAGMDGGDGGWAVLYGSNPLSATQLKIAVDEDQYTDTERNHTTEQCGYLVFE